MTARVLALSWCALLAGVGMKWPALAWAAAAAVLVSAVAWCVVRLPLRESAPRAPSSGRHLADIYSADDVPLFDRVNPSKRRR